MNSPEYHQTPELQAIRSVEDIDGNAYEVWSEPRLSTRPSDLERIKRFTETDNLIRDDITRFESVFSVREHEKQGARYYTLRDVHSQIEGEPHIDRVDALVGIAWIRPESRVFETDTTPNHTVNPSHTFAIRIYEPARGRQLSGKFMKAVVEDVFKHQVATGLWLSVKKRNIRARRLYKRQYFRESSALFTGMNDSRYSEPTIEMWRMAPDANLRNQPLVA